jgi:hypothetical protein
MKTFFTYDERDCFYRNDDYWQYKNVVQFCDMAADHVVEHKDQRIRFYWPDYKYAPWHVQCVMRLDGEYKEVNFWPHKAKGQIKYEKSVEGLPKFFAELRKRAGDGDPDDDFDVFE